MQLQMRNPELTDGDYLVYVNGSNMRGGGRGFAVIQLDKLGAVDAIFDEPEELDRLIIAASAAKQKLINARTPHLHQQAEGTARCLHCGVIKGHHVEPAPKPAAALEHMCECGHFEAYHVGAVLGDEHPGQCTSCDTCDTYAAAGQ